MWEIDFFHAVAGWKAYFMKVNEVLSWDNENTVAKGRCEIVPVDLSSHLILYYVIIFGKLSKWGWFQCHKVNKGSATLLN